MMLYICEKFHNNISNGFQVTIPRMVFKLQSGNNDMVKTAMFNVQRARHVIVLYICVKFRENISDGIGVMEWPRMIEALSYTQHFGGYNIIPSPLFVAGRHFLWRGIKRSRYNVKNT